jgi:hypothetical protein
VKVHPEYVKPTEPWPADSGYCAWPGCAWPQFVGGERDFNGRAATPLGPMHFTCALAWRRERLQLDPAANADGPSTGPQTPNP